MLTIRASALSKLHTQALMHVCSLLERIWPRWLLSVFNSHFQADVTKDACLFVSVRSEEQGAMVGSAMLPQHLAPALQTHCTSTAAAHRSALTSFRPKERRAEALKCWMKTLLTSPHHAFCFLFTLAANLYLSMRATY